MLSLNPIQIDHYSIYLPQTYGRLADACVDYFTVESAIECGVFNNGCLNTSSAYWNAADRHRV